LSKVKQKLKSGGLFQLSTRECRMVRFALEMYQFGFVLQQPISKLANGAQCSGRRVFKCCGGKN